MNSRQTFWSVALAALIGIIAETTPCWADFYTFQFSDISGDAAHGQLFFGSSGLGDGSVLATSGFITVTASSNGNLPTGTYPLAAGGPAIGGNNFFFDNLLYPAGDAASGSHNAGGFNGGIITNPSYLTQYGLAFGDQVTAGPAVGIWGNGSQGATCCGGVNNPNGDYAFYG